MNRQISFSQYRTIDLVIMAGLLAVSLFAIHLAVNLWFPEQLYVVSPMAAIAAIVMMRWGGWAAIHMVLGGVLFVSFSGGGWQQYLIYGGGNLAALLLLLLLHFVGKQRVRQKVWLSVVFALGVQLAMQLGRAGLALLLGYEPEVCLGFITTDLLSALFTVLTIWIVRRIDGLFEDQKHYLLRINSEEQAEGRESF